MDNEKLDEVLGTVRSVEDAVLKVEKLLKEQRNTNNTLGKALKTLSGDMHEAGMRPCPTCNTISHVLGYPFGCNQIQEDRKT